MISEETLNTLFKVHWISVSNLVAITGMEIILPCKTTEKLTKYMKQLFADIDHQVMQDWNR